MFSCAAADVVVRNIVSAGARKPKLQRSESVPQGCSVYGMFGVTPSPLSMKPLSCHGFGLVLKKFSGLAGRSRRLA